MTTIQEARATRAAERERRRSPLVELDRALARIYARIDARCHNEHARIRADRERHRRALGQLFRHRPAKRGKPHGKTD